jgi:glycosyltransferase involved in cell wall biosynthesis
VNDRPLSILCVFRNQKEDAETTLSLLYEQVNVPFELVVVDDASDDGTAEVLDSVVGHFQHDATFVYTYPEHRGPAACLNDALQNSTAPVVWMPGVRSDLDTHALANAVSTVLRAQAPFMVCGGEVPIRADRWVEAIMDCTLPPDGAFLIRRDAINPHQRFLNPFLNRSWLSEWIIRTDTAGLVLSQSEPLGSQSVPYLSDADKNELLLSLVRTGRWKLSDISDYYKSVKTAASVKLGTEISTLERLVRDGEIQTALEKVDALLALDPDRQDALLLKIRILEKLRKYVEAAELKRKLNGTGLQGAPVIRKTPILVVDPSEDPGEVVEVDPADDLRVHEEENGADAIRPDAPTDAPIRISIIIPTSTDRRDVLEACLSSLHHHADGTGRELIVIDNGCIDDTPEVLDDLAASGFLNLRVLHHPKNLGFGKAVNSAMELAKGRVLVVMHNDVTVKDDVPGMLADTLDANADVAVVGVLADRIDHPLQQAAAAGVSGLTDVVYVEGVCMAFRRQDRFRFDESYGKAWFDDVDFCLEAAKDGRRIVIQQGAWVAHARGITTNDLGVGVQSDRYWLNADHFHRKWNYRLLPSIDPGATVPIDKLLAIGAIINPLYPETPLLKEAVPLLTSEARHEILVGHWTQTEIDHLLRLLMALNLRELLRAMEDKLDPTTADPGTVEILIRYYHRLRIFSRCRLYVESMPESRRTFDMMLHLLEIAVEEGEMEKAAELATALSGSFPVNPSLLRLSAAIHEHYRNTEDVKAFRSLAEKVDPVLP